MLEVGHSERSSEGLCKHATGLSLEDVNEGDAAIKRCESLQLVSYLANCRVDTLLTKHLNCVGYRDEMCPGSIVPRHYNSERKRDCVDLNSNKSQRLQIDLTGTTPQLFSHLDQTIIDRSKSLKLTQERVLCVFINFNFSEESSAVHFIDTSHQSDKLNLIRKRNKTIEITGINSVLDGFNCDDDVEVVA